MVKGIRAMATLLGIHQSTLKAWMRKGIFPRGKKRGGMTSPMIWESDNVERYLEKPHE